jgi:uncharacterized membrane protein
LDVKFFKWRETAELIILIAVVGGLAAVSALVFVSLQIRHLWQGAVSIHLFTGDGELYSYSVVWLMIATVTILYAASRQRRHYYLWGMGLLLVVVAKLFLIDMAHLDGQWRVASFMGLGLSLLVLAYLYTDRLRQRHPHAPHPYNGR